MTERKDIGARLETWSRWATARGSRGADCMTGAICDGLRKAAVGNVRSGSSTDPIDASDAIRIEQAMHQIPVQQKMLLDWCYIKNARPEVICRKLSIPVRPASEFVNQFRAAQQALEQAVDNRK
jgi:DNA-directed RNA polymerase specialized sigma24 family protein